MIERNLFFVEPKINNLLTNFQNLFSLKVSLPAKIFQNFIPKYVNILSISPVNWHIYYNIPSDRPVRGIIIYILPSDNPVKGII